MKHSQNNVKYNFFNLLLSTTIGAMILYSQPSFAIDTFDGLWDNGIGINLAHKNGEPIKGKTIDGYAFEFCAYPYGRVNFCTLQNAKNIIYTAEKYQKPKFLKQYVLVTVDAPDKKTSSIVLVDTKAKKVLGSNLEFKRGARVTYKLNTMEPVIYLHDTEAINGFNYHEGSRAMLSLDEKTGKELAAAKFIPRHGDIYSVEKNTNFFACWDVGTCANAEN